MECTRLLSVTFSQKLKLVQLGKNTIAPIIENIGVLSSQTNQALEQMYPRKATVSFFSVGLLFKKFKLIKIDI